MVNNHQRIRPLVKLGVRSGLSLASLAALASGAVVAASAPAHADGSESARPVCESMGGGRSRCAYSGKNPAPQPYKYYEGQLSNGIPSGQGLLVYTNDDRYQGSLRNGVPSGQGMFVFKDNSRYEGEMDRGYPNGSGTFTLSNGDRYTGGVRDGHPHGSGTLVFANGTVFSGEFFLGQVRGNGTYTSKAIRCQGYFFSSELSGNGSCSFPSGSNYRSYTGEWRNGRPDGRGSAVLADGTAFSGEFRQGIPFVPSLYTK
jgi:hypothetical protein